VAKAANPRAGWGDLPEKLQALTGDLGRRLEAQPGDIAARPCQVLNESEGTGSVANAILLVCCASANGAPRRPAVNVPMNVRRVVAQSPHPPAPGETGIVRSSALVSLEIDDQLELRRPQAGYAAHRLCAPSKAGATSAMKRAISSLTWACGFNPTLKYRITSWKPAASTCFKVSVMRSEEPRRTEFSVRSSGFTLWRRSTISMKYR